MRKNKIYRSFEDIDKDLEILKLERELAMRKLFVSGENITETLAPSNLFKSGMSFLLSSLKSKTTLSGIVYSFLIKRMLNKVFKR